MIDHFLCLISLFIKINVDIIIIYSIEIYLINIKFNIPIYEQISKIGLDNN